MERHGFLAAVVTAAGRSERFGGVKKELFRLGGRSVLELAFLPFLRQPDLDALVITAPPGREAELEASISDETRKLLSERLGPRFALVPGGNARRDSVLAGLEALAKMFESGGAHTTPGAVGSSATAASGAAASGAAWAAGRGLDPALDDCIVLVHDAARPWVSAELVSRVAEAARERGACVPVTSLVDTPKVLGDDRVVTGHPPRSSLGAAQTPQGFRLAPLLEAHRRAGAEGIDCTDDAELWARYVGPVAWIEGEKTNKKITFREDLAAAAETVAPEDAAMAEATPPGPAAGPATAATANAAAAAADSATPASAAVDLFAAAAAATAAAGSTTAASPALSSAAPASEPGPATAVASPGALPFRVGQGWDLHRLAKGRRLMIGGVQLPSELGEDAHSDGDVLIHAVIDAMLGAAALGDIGTYFPPSDARWKDADSRELLSRTLELVRAAGWEPGNLDCTVVLERPKIGPHSEAVRASLAFSLGVDIKAVSIKAKTAEGLGDIGAGRAIEASALVTLFPRRHA